MMAIDHTDRKIAALQEQIDDMALVICHLRDQTAPQQFASEPADQINDAIEEEEARKGALAWEIVLDYLSRQWLPYDVKLAYDHIRKGLEYDA